MSARLPVSPVDSIRLANSDITSTGRVALRHQRSKRSIDLALASMLVLLLIPVFLATMILVRVTSRGPVLFRQRRIGLDGVEFTLLKFRSMSANADQSRAALVCANESDGPLFKMRSDPRVTRVGRWLRRLSLDELPQLLNVVSGSMSLVGPRPALPAEAATYDSAATRRLSVKPGLTGLWQVSGRSDLTWQEGLELDLRYVDQHSARLDLEILLRTLPAVLTGRGAY